MRWIRQRMLLTHAFIVRAWARITGNRLLYIRYMGFPVLLRDMVRRAERDARTCPRCNGSVHKSVIAEHGMCYRCCDDLNPAVQQSRIEDQDRWKKRSWGDDNCADEGCETCV